MYVPDSLSDVIVSTVMKYYLNSPDFNGMRLEDVVDAVPVDQYALDELLPELIAARRVDLVFARTNDNPFIKRVPALDPDDQIARLRAADDRYCIYPTPEVLRGGELPDLHQRPYTHRLASGEPQLVFVCFDLAVLERYYSDPRYHFEITGAGGRIVVLDEFYQSENMQEHDKVLLQSFGIGYDSGQHRVVVVFLRYLHDLSPEHQQYWKSYANIDDCTPNSDYARASLAGEWPDSMSVYDALIGEQRAINRLCEAIGKPPLFRQVYSEDRPRGFHLMLRPTKQAFHDFVHLLDKLLSENINRDFFRGDIELEERITRGDGTEEVRQIRTLRLLEQWLGKNYTVLDDPHYARQALDPFRRVRAIRQEPAHKIVGNEYDLSFPKQQDDLVADVYYTLKLIRMILQKHPAAAETEVESWLDGSVVIY